MNLKCLRKYMWMIRYGLIFVFAVYMFSSLPLIQDAWVGAEYYSSQENVVTAVRDAIISYNSDNGRVLAKIIVGFFERNKALLDLANSILFTVIVYWSTKIIFGDRRLSKDCIGELVSFLVMIAIPVAVRREVYFYASMIYVFPILTFVLFLEYIQKIERNEQVSTVKLVALCVLNAGWIEHVGLAFLSVLLVLFIWAFFKKKDYISVLTKGVVVSVLTFLIMMGSPGLRQNRSIKSESGLALLIQKNIALVVDTLVFQQWLIISILLVTFAFLQIYKKKNISFLPVLNMILALLVISLRVHAFAKGARLEFIGDAQINEAIYCILGMIVLILIFADVLVCRNMVVLLCYLCGIFSVTPIIITPNFGYRICYFGVVCIGLLLIIFVKQLLEYISKYRKVILCIVAVLVFIQVDSYSLTLERINGVQKERERIIEKVLMDQMMGDWNYDETVVLPRFSAGDLYADACPSKYDDLIHYNCLLRYYHLDERTLIQFSDDKNILNAKLDKQQIILKANLEYECDALMYGIENNGEIIESKWTTFEDKAVFDLPSKYTGYLRFFCGYRDKTGEFKVVYSVNYLEND